MKIIADTREQAPYGFTRWPEVVLERAALATGDYSVAGMEHRIAIERKSLDDLVGCLMGDGRGRFERELARARGLDCFVVVIEASMQDVAAHRYRSKMEPHAVMQSILAFQVRHGAAFMWCDSRDRGEYICYSLLTKYRREREMELRACINAGKRPPKTSQNAMPISQEGTPAGSIVEVAHG